MARMMRRAFACMIHDQTSAKLSTDLHIPESAPTQSNPPLLLIIESVLSKVMFAIWVMLMCTPIAHIASQPHPDYDIHKPIRLNLDSLVFFTIHSQQPA